MDLQTLNFEKVAIFVNNKLEAQFLFMYVYLFFT